MRVGEITDTNSNSDEQRDWQREEKDVIGIYFLYYRLYDHLARAWRKAEEVGANFSIRVSSTKREMYAKKYSSTLPDQRNLVDSIYCFEAIAWSQELVEILA